MAGDCAGARVTERRVPLSDDELHRLYRLCDCGRWMRRSDVASWDLHRAEFCPDRTAVQGVS